MNDIIGYYINLNKRKDRKTNIENIKKKIQFFQRYKKKACNTQ